MPPIVMAITMTSVIVMSRIPAATVVVITAVGSLIIISIGFVEGTVMIEPEPSVRRTKTMTPEVSVMPVASVAVILIRIIVTPSVATGHQFYRYAVFRLKPIQIMTGRRSIGILVLGISQCVGVGRKHQ